MFRCLVAFLLLTVSSFAQSFTKTDYAVGSNPRGIVSADFNRDGVADLAVANHDSGTVSILLGRGDGTFGAATAVTVAANPTEMVTADFNGDGIADLAVAGSTVTILLGNGDGTFKRGDVAVSSSSITAADFNGDGHIDLAVVTGGKVQIILSDGNLFTPGLVLSGEVPFAVVRAADLNRDGKMDLAIGACCQGSDVTYGAVYSAIGGGNGTFSVSKITDQSDGTRLTAADVTGDGVTDLILPYQGCHTPCTGVEVMVNDAGSFTRFGGAGLSTLDYSGPGQAVVGNFGGGTQIAVPFGPGEYVTDGSGAGLSKVLIFTIGSDGKSTAQGDYALGHNYGGWGIVAGDFNHDGKMDLAVTDASVGKVTVLLNAQAPVDFVLTTFPASVTVKAGDKTQVQYALEATNGSLPNIQLSCSGLPAGATCAFDNTLPGGQISEGWVTIQTTARTSAAVQANRLLFFAMMLPFGFVVLPGDRRKRALWIGLALLAFAVMLQTGCGGSGSNSMSSNAAVNGSGSNSTGASAGGSSTGTSSGAASGSNGGSTGSGSTGSGSSTGGGSGSGGSGSGGGTSSSGTPAGTYQVTINATGGGVSHTSNLTLVVQ